MRKLKIYEIYCDCGLKFFNMKKNTHGKTIHLKNLTQK